MSDIEQMKEKWNRTIPKSLPNVEIEKFAGAVADFWISEFILHLQSIREVVEEYKCGEHKKLLTLINSKMK